MWTVVSMIAIVVSMVGVGVFVWRKVGMLEQGDTALEEKLRADDERAEAGRRRRAGLPPKGQEPSAQSGSHTPGGESQPPAAQQ